MPVQPSELREFFSYVIAVLDKLGIPYMVVGGFAAIFYGEPRMTIDVDVVVDMKMRHIKAFVEAFPIPSYYVSEEAITFSPFAGSSGRWPEAKKRGLRQHL